MGLKQLVKTPAMITKTSKTLIDYVIDNDYKLSVNV